MDITPVVPKDLQVIDSYGAGMFRISGVPHTGSLLVLPERTLSWHATAVVSLTVADFEPLTRADPPIDILLLGCGSRMELVPGALRMALRNHGIGIEPMDTGAACRTYNVLLGEGRRVAAALIAL